MQQEEGPSKRPRRGAAALAQEAAKRHLAPGKPRAPGAGRKKGQKDQVPRVRKKAGRSSGAWSNDTHKARKYKPAGPTSTLFNLQQYGPPGNKEAYEHYKQQRQLRAEAWEAFKQQREVQHAAQTLLEAADTLYDRLPEEGSATLISLLEDLLGNDCSTYGSSSSSGRGAANLEDTATSPPPRPARGGLGRQQQQPQQPQQPSPCCPPSTAAATQPTPAPPTAVPQQPAAPATARQRAQPQQLFKAKKPWSQLKTATQRKKLKLVEELCQGDLAGLCEFILVRNLPVFLDLIRKSQRLLGNELDEQVVQRLKREGAVSPERALALLIELDMSQKEYTGLRKYLPGALPPLTDVLELKKKLEPELVELQLSDNTPFGWAVKDVCGTICTELEFWQQHYKAQGLQLPTCLRLKIGADNFQARTFYRAGINSEQIAAYLLLDVEGRPCNSPFHMIPLVKYTGKEEGEAFAVAACHVFDQLRAACGQQPGMLPLTLEDGTEVTVELFQGADLMCNIELLGHGGHNSTYNCIWCWHRHGPHVSDYCVQPCPVVRTLAQYASDWRNPQRRSQVNQKHEPYTCIPPEKIIVEELHMRLNLVNSHWLFAEKLGREAGQDEGVLKQRMDELGVPRPATCNWEGYDCSLVLSLRAEWLPDLKCIGEEKYQALCRTWDLLATLLGIAHKPKPTNEEIDEFERLASEFGRHLMQHFPHSTNREKKVAAAQARASQVEWESQVDSVLCTQGFLGLLAADIPLAPAQGAPVCLGYAFGFYDHALVCHAPWQLRRFGSLFMFSSWYLEHANKWWKQFAAGHSSFGGGHAEAVKSGNNNPDKQAFKRMFLLTSSTVRSEMKKEARLRGPYVCGKCGDELFEGHAKVCRARRAAMAAPSVVSHL